MKYGELIGNSLFVGKTVEFMAGIRHMEQYAEQGMRAIIRAVDVSDSDDDVCIVTFDFAPFAAYNKQFEIKGAGHKGMSADGLEEYGFYMDDDEGIEEMFAFIGSEKDLRLLKNAFEESGSASYVSWLEGHVLEKLKLQ